MLSQQLKQIILVLPLVIIACNGFAATTSNPCHDVSLLAITDRGSITNTPCVMPSKTVLLETGYQYKHFSEAGSLQNFPQSTLFIGLPGSSELALVLPTYNQQPQKPFSGLSATSAGIKHEFVYGENWVAAGEVFVNPPGGSSGFGSQGTGVIVNGMASYDLNSQLSATLMVGGSTLTVASYFGGERFNSFNPSLVLLYTPIEKLSVFAEVFGQTRTGPGLSGNYNADFGVLYLLTPNVVLDLEAGQQLGHQTESFNQFVGAGVSVKL